jgi:hypothetical protein
MQFSFATWRQVLGVVATTLLAPTSVLALPALPTVNLVTDFGAVGNGKADDHQAFSKAEAYLNAHPAGAKLIIPSGTYLVGRQGAGNTPGVNGYYHGDDVLELTQCRNVTIEGQGNAVIKFRAGLKFGHFNGEYWTPGYGIHLRNCTGVAITNLTIDGNSDNYYLGSNPAEIGANQQIEGDNDGIYVDGTRNVTLTKVNARHMGRDGIMLKFADGAYLKGAAPVNLVMTGCAFEYNGRDGFSWVAGAGVQATNCRFNNQGQGLIRAGLRAGIDVEPEGGNYLWNGTFTNCQFVNNLQTGVLADANPSSAPDQARAIQFVGCTISGNFQPGKGGGPAVVAKWPNLTFSKCTVYGELRNAYNAPDDQSAVKFSACSFTDAPLNGQETTETALVQLYHAGSRTQFDQCDFTIHAYTRCFTQIDNLGNPPSQNIRFKSCRFHTAYTTPLTPNMPLTRAKATTITFEGNCQFLSDATLGPRRPRKTALTPSGVHIETPIYSFWPAQIVGTLSLSGGPDIRYMIDSNEITVQAGSTLTVNDRNELLVYSGGSLRVEKGATVVINSGGELTTIGSGLVHLDGTLIVKSGGFVCGDWGTPIIVGPTGRIQYDQGANLRTDPLRYPDNERNCQGTPPPSPVAKGL